MTTSRWAGIQKRLSAKQLSTISKAIVFPDL